MTAVKDDGYSLIVIVTNNWLRTHHVETIEINMLFVYLKF